MPRNMRFSLRGGRSTAALGASIIMVTIGVQLAIMPARAAKPTGGLTFTNAAWAYELQNPVEQQSPAIGPPYFPNSDPAIWVHNGTGCVWDEDDSQLHSVGNGSLSPGASATDLVCFVADWAGRNWMGHATGVALYSASPNLRLTIAFSPGDSHVIGLPSWDETARAWRYQECVTTPSYQSDDPALQPIPDSNGGVGVPTQATLTITNVGSHRASKIHATWGITNPWIALSAVCPA